MKVLMYLASMSTRKTSTNRQIFQHNDVFHNFSLDRSCLSHRDWVQDVISKYGIGKSVDVNIESPDSFVVV